MSTANSELNPEGCKADVKLNTLIILGTLS